jgi:hypothetical protein
MNNQPVSLANLVGQNILIKIPAFKDGAMVTVKLIALENGGIWIESQEFMEDMFAGTSHTMTANTFVLFLPFAQILTIYSTVPSPWISKRVVE